MLSTVSAEPPGNSRSSGSTRPLSTSARRSPHRSVRVTSAIPTAWRVVSRAASARAGSVTSAPATCQVASPSWRSRPFAATMSSIRPNSRRCAGTTPSRSASSSVVTSSPTTGAQPRPTSASITKLTVSSFERGDQLPVLVDRSRISDLFEPRGDRLGKRVRERAGANVRPGSAAAHSGCHSTSYNQSLPP